MMYGVMNDMAVVDDVNMGIDSGILYDDMGSVPMGSESSGLSSNVVLIIVIAVCIVAGIGLGILAGKRSANK